MSKKEKKKKGSAEIQQAANFLQKDRMTTTTAQTTPFPPYRIGPQTLAGLTVASPSWCAYFPVFFRTDVKMASILF